jgi:8-oxo-dGTP pyrophosphatase MutT (NUDIX family)
MRKKIQLGVAVLVYHPKNNTFVTVNRHENPLLRCLPSGKVEKGETDIEAAARELYEETGLVVKPKHLMPIHTGISQNGKAWVTTFMSKLGKGIGNLDFDSPEGLHVQLLDQDDFMDVTAFPDYHEEVFKAYHYFWDMVPDMAN